MKSTKEMKEWKKRIGSTLLATRKEKKKTQGYLAKKTGLTEAAISQTENGKRLSFNTLCLLALALEVPIYQILQRAEE